MSRRTSTENRSQHNLAVRFRDFLFPFWRAAFGRERAWFRREDGW